MKAGHIDVLNIGLIFLSLVIAFLLPFRLFLFAYAVLGPLHYITEINWLRNKNYFVHQKNWVWIPCLFALLILAPKLIVYPAFAWMGADNMVGSFIQYIGKYNNGFIFLWLALSVGLVLTKKWVNLIIISVFGIILAVLLNGLSSYEVIVGLFIPTVIHVYLFTLLFMLYGALRNKSKAGYLSVLLLALCPVFISFVGLSAGNYEISDGIKQTFVDGRFYMTNTKLAHFLGLNDGTQFSFEALLDIKVQVFIAFAYTYHYLNWFSKTTVIGWHKNLTKGRTILILLVWVASVFLYWYDYTTAIIILLSLSILHVFLEFPLNVISIKSISREVGILVKK